MSLQVAVDFQINFISDGTSTSLKVSLANAPFVFWPDQAGFISDLFSLLTSKPSGVTNLTANNGYDGTITATIAPLGLEATFDFSPAPASGETTLFGTFTF